MKFDPVAYKFLDVEGVKIAYQRSGTGEPVVLVHGITTYSFIWRKVIPFLEENYDLIRIDLLGCGASQISTDFDLSLRHHSEVIHAFLKKLSLKKVHLVGHDVGGGIAQILAVKHPAYFKTVSLLNPVGYDYWPVYPITAMRTPIFRQLAMAAFDKGYYRSIVKKALYFPENSTEELLDYFWSNFESSESKKSFLRFAKCLNNNNLMEIEEDLKRLKVPCLLLRAEKDVYLSKSICDDLHANIPGSILREVPKSGHYMQEDAPDTIASYLRDFWNTKVHG